MGLTSAVDMLNVAGSTESLKGHLQSNHYPPVSLAFIPDAEKAIELMAKGKSQEPVLMVNGVTLSAGHIVDALHLAPWVLQKLAENNEQQVEEEVEVCDQPMMGD